MHTSLTCRLPVLLFAMGFMPWMLLRAQQPVETTYPQHVFDSDTCCWRKLARQGAYPEAARLVEAFLRTDNAVNRQSLHWHAGQLWAMCGNNKPALKHFRKTYHVWQKWLGGEDGKTWYYFAKGTVAAITRDQRTLNRVVSKWKKKWPPDRNYRELLRLQANGGLSYEEATR